MPLRPSNIFLKWLRLSPVYDLIEKRLERLYKELEVYEYFAQLTPNNVEEKVWIKLLSTDNIYHRVTKLNDVALIEVKSRRHILEQAINQTLSTARFALEMDRMRPVSMINIPYLNLSYEFKDKNTLLYYGSKSYQNIRLNNELPHFILDFQSFDTMNQLWRDKFAHQTMMLIYDNYYSRVHLPLSLVNFDAYKFNMNVLINKHLQFYSSYNNMSKVLAPELYSDFPKEFQNPDEVAIISKEGRNVLDGPLTHKAYIIPMYKEDESIVIGNARRMGIQTYTFPVVKYIRWRSGGKDLARPTMLNIFRDVITSGGDWHWALHANIPIHSMRSYELTHSINAKGSQKRLSRFIYNSDTIVNYIKQAFDEDKNELGKDPSIINDHIKRSNSNKSKSAFNEEWLATPEKF